MNRSIILTILAVVVGSQLQAATIDETTSGDWIGTYGEAGYILPFYDGPGSTWTAPVDTTTDVASLPAYVTNHSYTATGGGVVGPYGYKWGTYIPEGNAWFDYSLADPREVEGEPVLTRESCCIYYDGGSGMTVSLTLAADATDFQMAVYAYDFGEDHDRSESVAVQWQGEAKPFEVALLDDYWEGKWAVFDIVPDGNTQLDIILTPSMGTLGNETVLQAIMFDAISNPNMPGDADGDGDVDVSDLGILATNYGTIGGATWAQADFTGEGDVDVSDLGILATHYGTTSANAVPEPSACVLLAAGLVVLSTLARRKRKQ